MNTKINLLIIDNTLDQPYSMGTDFREHFTNIDNVFVEVRRAPQRDWPQNMEQYSHVILSGSRTSCEEESAWVDELISLIHKTVELEIPILGVCFGHQMIARAFHGKTAVGSSQTPEFGWVKISQNKEKHPLFLGLDETFHSFQSHVEEVRALPKDFVVTAQSDRCSIQAYYHLEKPIFGIQFHPERNAQKGETTIKNRLKDKPKDCIFGVGMAKSLYSKHVADTIFKNFFKQKRQSR